MNSTTSNLEIPAFEIRCFYDWPYFEWLSWVLSDFCNFSASSTLWRYASDQTSSGYYPIFGSVNYACFFTGSRSQDWNCSHGCFQVLWFTYLSEEEVSLLLYIFHFESDGVDHFSNCYCSLLIIYFHCSSHFDFWICQTNVLFFPHVATSISYIHPYIHSDLIIDLDFTNSPSWTEVSHIFKPSQFCFYLLSLEVVHCPGPQI